MEFILKIMMTSINRYFRKNLFITVMFYISINATTVIYKVSTEALISTGFPSKLASFEATTTLPTYRPTFYSQVWNQ